MVVSTTLHLRTLGTFVARYATPAIVNGSFDFEDIHENIHDAPHSLSNALKLPAAEALSVTSTVVVIILWLHHLHHQIGRGRTDFARCHLSPD